MELYCFCFGKDKNQTIFLQLVKLLYADQATEILHEGHRSNQVSIRRGVWQGCPLSSHLFILIIEMLNLAVKQSLDIDVDVQYTKRFFMRLIFKKKTTSCKKLLENT